MKATNVLMEEHRVIERVLETLRVGADKLESSEPIQPEFFLDAADFIKGFADGCHHKKEEGVLFPKMEQQGVLSKGGPIGVMLSEHQMGREFTKSMREGAERLLAGDSSAQDQVIQSARNYVELLQQHIFKEDNILFPLADRVIPQSDQEQVWEDFEHVEHEETGEGVHEKYLALAEKLEREIA